MPIAPLLVAVPMVQIGPMWMRVAERLVPVNVRMRFLRDLPCGVRVLVMLVMQVTVLVLHGFMRVPVGVLFHQEEHHPQGENERRSDLVGSEAVAEDGHSSDRSCERCERK